MKNTYEIIDETLLFHSENEIKEFNLSQVIEELEKSTNNLIEEQNGILKEYISSEDYLSSEEIDFFSTTAWVNVEIWQIEDAVENLTVPTSKHVTLDYEEIDLIKLLLSRMNEVSIVVYGHQKESILNKLNK